MAGKSNDKYTGDALDPVLIRNVVETSAERYLKLLEETLIQEHDVIVGEIARRIRAVAGGELAAPGETPPVSSDWVEIESLSRLRSIVGGRFQNLRDRWVGAGFPLREHRGDKDGEFALNESGWFELSNWILKQGFEARLTPDRPGCLFELRATK
ncbi:MAG: hypothetical protein RL417_1976 [Pseudomonadota bacterium]|jgi:hypothetical protein